MKTQTKKKQDKVDIVTDDWMKKELYSFDGEIKNTSRGIELPKIKKPKTNNRRFTW